MIAEPDVALTDLGLAVEAAVLAWLVHRGGAPAPLRRWWVVFFASVASSALLGGIVHGFFTDGTAPAAIAAWRATLLALGVTAVAAWAIGAHVALGPAIARRVVGLAALAWLAYAAVVALVSHAFAVAIAHYLPAALFMLAALTVAWRRRGERPVLVGALGLVVLLGGSWVQWRRIAIHPVYFTHNALYHAIQAVALLMLFGAARRLTGGRSMLTRRQFLAGTGALAPLAAGCARRREGDAGAVVNDIHSKLNATRVRRVVRPASVEDLAAAVSRARADGAAVSVAGGRHAMGGQQFGAGTVLIDTTGMDRVLAFDAGRGLVEVEAGIQWPALIDHLLRAQEGQPSPWGIVQKQTGADRLSLGGALAANVHGRGLALRPFVADVEAFTIVGPDGQVRRCSRLSHPELFRLAIGGYGLFGAVATVTLRLARRQKIERVVQVIDMEGLGEAFERRIAAGFTFGDCQYATDPSSDDFLRRGVFSCYRPVDADRPVPAAQKELSVDDWNRLLHLSHTDKRRAFELYAGYYLTTHGQVYWSDTHQLSVYVDDYHAALDRQLGAAVPATEIITEIYVPRPALAAFLADVRTDFRRERVDLVYGTVRLIERDDETFLPWARDRWACVIFNLHTEHSPAGLERSASAFRRLIDLGRSRGGSYFLTYHRFATRAQVEACYPQFAAFLRAKRRWDPDERFQSEWYRHYRQMFADVV